MEWCEKCLQNSIKHGCWPGLSALKLRHFECYKKCVDALTVEAKSRVLDGLLFTDDLEYLKYAVDAKCTVELNMLKYASRKNVSLDVVKYLYENGHVNSMSESGHCCISDRLMEHERIDCLEYLASIDKLYIDHPVCTSQKKIITQTGSPIIDSYILKKINGKADKFLVTLLYHNDIDFAEKIIHKYPELTFPGPVQASIFESCEYDICKDNVKIISFCIRYGLIPDVYESMIVKEYDDDDYDDEDDYLRRLNEENPVLKKLNYLEMMARLYICPKILRYIRNNRSYIRFALWYTVPTLLMVDKFRGQLLFSCIKDIVSYV